jgi:hypothetical protein
MESIFEPTQEFEDYGEDTNRAKIHDPYITEFLAFCKINEIEDLAIKLLEKKIKVLKRSKIN